MNIRIAPAPITGLFAVLTLFSLAAPGTATAQRTAARPAIDRSKQPTPGETPVLKVPAWTSTRLSNGAELVVSQKRDLPLVSVSINFIGGSNQFEDPQKLGVASFTASMLSEGTTTKTGDQLADAQQLLGTRISTGIGDENGEMGFTALSDKLQPALELMADMMLNPRFPAEALERLRAQRLVALTQAKDRPGAIASNVFSKVVYGDAHPYGRVITEETTRAITRDDIVAFHRAYFQPGRASITVVGDVDPAQVKAAFETAFATWAAGGERPSFAYPPAPQSKTTTIYLVDKPEAAQSVINIGHPGPPRTTPDFYALNVMNRILGGLFQSRLNHLIREVRGFSYGAGSDFSFGRGPGPFSAGAAVVSEKTDSALVDFMNELRGVQGGKPFTPDEIQQGKESLIQSLPRRFASVDGVNGAISSLYLNDLPDNYYHEFASKVNAVTPDDLTRVAKQYIDMNRLNIVIVGDRATIEELLRKAGIAPITILDIEGKPVPMTP
ncbi:MAG: M16 family metallopeptidase [Gemmatimonadaceae bacterium]